jgi:hypothetical protein
VKFAYLCKLTPALLPLLLPSAAAEGCCCCCCCSAVGASSAGSAEGAPKNSLQINQLQTGGGFRTLPGLTNRTKEKQDKTGQKNKHFNSNAGSQESAPIKACRPNRQVK